MTALQRQAIDLAGRDARPLVARRQQADVTENQDRQVRLQLANAQFGFRVTQFQRAFHAAVVIGRATIALHR